MTSDAELPKSLGPAGQILPPARTGGNRLQPRDRRRRQQDARQQHKKRDEDESPAAEDEQNEPGASRSQQDTDASDGHLDFLV